MPMGGLNGTILKMKMCDEGFVFPNSFEKPSAIQQRAIIPCLKGCTASFNIVK